MNMYKRLRLAAHILIKGEKINDSEFESLHSKYYHVPRYTPLHMEFRNFSIHASDAASVVWQIKDYFFDENYKFNSEKNSPLIYDCGANIGIACLYFKSLFPQASIKAFEADSKIAGYLHKNLQKNNASNSIEVINKAVWINDGGIEFGSEGADGGSIFNTENKSRVASVRLKELIEQEHSIDFLKMDIEGAETDVIIDCKNVLKKIEYLFIEHHSFSEDSRPIEIILNILSENKFKYHLRTVSETGSPFEKNGHLTPNKLVNIFAVNEHY
jgi:FkbM family methyltransferase